MSGFAQIEAHVAGDIRLVGPPARVIERLRQRFSFRNPDFVRARRSGEADDTIPPRVECIIEEPDGSVRVPRGGTTLLREVLAEDLYRARYVDARAAGEQLAPEVSIALVRFLEDKPLRYYQEAAIREITNTLQGTVVIPCGGGKTTLGGAAIGALGRSALIVVHTQDLFDQWVGTIRAMLSVEPGYVRANGESNIQPITVAMVISLARFLGTDEGAAACARFGVVLVDECHHAPCETFQRVLPRLPARVRVGLTATPEREDAMDDLMNWSFGARLLEIETLELIAKGYLVAPRVEFVESPFDFDYTPPEKPRKKEEEIRLAKLQKQLVQCAARNAIIADIATRDAKNGETVLILSNHKAHCRTLGRLCWERGVEPVVLIAKGGKAAKKKRADHIQGMRDGNVRLAIATSLFDEGVDVARLSRVIFALPERARGRIQQRTGRLMRPFEGKTPVLYDIVDPKVETLVNRATERRRTYKRLGILR